MDDIIIQSELLMNSPETAALVSGPSVTRVRLDHDTLFDPCGRISASSTYHHGSIYPEVVAMLDVFSRARPDFRSVSGDAS